MAALRAAAAFSAALRRRYQQASNSKSEVFRQADTLCLLGTGSACKKTPFSRKRAEVG